eukprot:scaffold292546_cov37-Tisochrysis_lutea.AAC.2
MGYDEGLPSQEPRWREKLDIVQCACTKSMHMLSVCGMLGHVGEDGGGGSAFFALGPHKRQAKGPLCVQL